MIGTTAADRTVSITLREWESVEPEPGSPLWGLSLPDDDGVRHGITEMAQRGILRLTEKRHGLAIEATSFVGRIRLGGIAITIQPKIAGLPLMRLLRYAYGLRNLSLSSDVEYAPTPEQPFQELLIHQLAAEARELTTSGLCREYIPAERSLTSPRGRIDMARIARDTRPGLLSRDLTLPCRYYERSADTSLNRALHAGLHFAARLTEDAEMRRELRVLQDRLETVGTSASSARTDRNSLLARARREQSRLTADYGPALILIEMLFASDGPVLDDATRSTVALPGFLFDMNRFFQALLERFLSENLPAPYFLRSEQALHGMLSYHPDFNPRRRQSPTPRPDFAIVSGGDIVVLLDAKYRDLWERPLPREMLYQLAIYALSHHEGSTARREAVILYPSVTPDIAEARIEIRPPVRGIDTPATIVLRAVDLPRLADLVSTSAPYAAPARTAFAERLCFGA